MQLILVVMGMPGASAAPLTALRFARAAIARGHVVRQVFCHGDGAGALLPVVAPSDETDVASAWRALSSAHGFPVLACVTAASRRGIDDARDPAAMASPGSLGQLMGAIGDDDVRVVTFG